MFAQFGGSFKIRLGDTDAVLIENESSLPSPYKSIYHFVVNSQTHSQTEAIARYFLLHVYLNNLITDTLKL